MLYPAPPYGVIVPPAQSVGPKIGIAVAICVAIILILGAIGIGLGVGLGVGLSRHSSSSSSSSSNSGSAAATATATTPYSILAAPTVTCTYGGSSTCGCSATSPSFLSPRIVQGYAAVANSWPWMVALYINNNQLFCGGFLVSYQHVVTAAHCVYGQSASGITVYAGIQKLSLRTSTGQSRGVSTITVHPSYTPSVYPYDVAVLTLQSPLTQTTTVGLCCLTSDTSLPAIGDRGVIIGWGYTVQGGPNLSDDLLQGVIEIQSDSSTCSTSSASTPSSLLFCAGYSGTDSCQGDSGSPFMTSVNNSWTCTGLVDFGSGCGVNAYYVRLAAFRSFINGVVSG